MLIWCITLFVLGILAFLDTFFNYGDIFRRVNSILFMLLSLGLLIRTSMMMKLGKVEKPTERNAEPEQHVTQFGKLGTPEEKEPEKVH